jgi:hypothetical protein
MRRAVAAVLVAASMAGCSPTGEADTTTSTPATTTSHPSTTATQPTTTTTVVESTTTATEASTTTTEFAVPGNWAFSPLITTAFGAVGWWAGSGWVSAAAAGELPVSGGEDYQVVALGSSGIITGGPQTTVCDPLENLGVELSDPGRLGDWPGPFGVAISAPWEVRPHLIRSFSDDGSYAGHARTLLASRGLQVPNPVIRQLLRVDLEGDGVNEVLVVAEEISGSHFEPQIGDYSIAFLRKVVDGDVQTAILGESLITSEDQLMESYRIGGVGDLSGDGKMEIVVSGAYYEGAWVAIWEYVDDDLGPTLQLSLGCGA